MPPSLDEQCILYWVHDETCLNVATHGYVGITAHEAMRKGVHRRRRPHATFTILFRGTRRECLAIEHQHRPERLVGSISNVAAVACAASFHNQPHQQSNTMKRILLAAMMLALSATASNAKDLPECNSDQVQHAFNDVWSGRVAQFIDINDLRSGDAAKQRWCHIYFLGRVGMRGLYIEATYTLEWINKSEGRYWLQIKQQEESSR